MPAPQFDNFRQFWRFYVAQHRQPATRWWHFAGTTVALLALVAIAAARRWLWLPAVPLCGYALAWFSHVAIERNRPATFGHPLWSLAADFKMWWLTATGRMGREVRLICGSEARRAGGGGKEAGQEETGQGGVQARSAGDAPLT